VILIVCLCIQNDVPEDVVIIEHQCLRNSKSLAEGGFGVVYRAEHVDWGTVAYKELKTSITPDSRSVFSMNCCNSVVCMN